VFDKGQQNRRVCFVLFSSTPSFFVKPKCTIFLPYVLFCYTFIICQNSHSLLYFSNLFVKWYLVKVCIIIQSHSIYKRHHRYKVWVNKKSLQSEPESFVNLRLVDWRRTEQYYASLLRQALETIRISQTLLDKHDK